MSRDPLTTDEEHAEARSTDRGRSALGSVLLFLGIGLLGFLLIDRGTGLPFEMPQSWYVNRTFWVAGGLISVVAGWRLLRSDDDEPDPDRKVAARPSRPMNRSSQQAPGRSEALIPGLGSPGPRFQRLVLYTRPGCHLCDDARAILDKYAAYLPPVSEVDIDRDPMLIARFSTCVPVIELDGKVRFRALIDELLLRRLIAAQSSRGITSVRENL